MIEKPLALESGATFASLSAPYHIKSDARYTKAGYVVAENASPTIYGRVYDAEVNEGRIEATIDDLDPGKEYHFRAFMNEYNGNIIYSPEMIIQTGEGTLDEQLAHYKGPRYADYYLDFAAWANRSQWNLANVHDPRW